MEQYTKRIVDVPNSGIIQIMEEVEKAARNGYSVVTNPIYISLGPAVLDIELVFQKDNEDEIDWIISSKELMESDDPIELDEEASKILLTDLCLDEINSAQKTKELREIAEKYNLHVDMNKKHPDSLRKYLLSQIESE